MLICRPPVLTPEPLDASGWRVQTEPEHEPVAMEASCAPSSQQGPISQKAYEPDTLVVGNSTIKDITGKKIKTCYFPHIMVDFIDPKMDSDLHVTSNQ